MWYSTWRFILKDVQVMPHVECRLLSWQVHVVGARFGSLVFLRDGHLVFQLAAVRAPVVDVGGR